MNEAETLDAHILPALKAAGWGAEGTRIRRKYTIAPGRIEGGGRRGPALKADILLEYRNTKLAVKYQNSIADAVADLGRPEEISEVFTGFQKYLYRDVA